MSSQMAPETGEKLRKHHSWDPFFKLSLSARCLDRHYRHRPPVSEGSQALLKDPHLETFGNHLTGEHTTNTTSPKK